MEIAISLNPLMILSLVIRKVLKELVIVHVDRSSVKARVKRQKVREINFEWTKSSFFHFRRKTLN